MKIAKTAVIFLMIFFFISVFRLFSLSEVGAQSPEDQRLNNLNQQIEQYQNDIERLKKQANTLSNQIAQFNTQIVLTSLEIAKKEEQILILTGRIVQLSDSLDSLYEAFSNRAVETYKMARVGDSFMILISAPDLSKAISRFHYLKRIQEEDRKLFNRLEEAQDDYKEEKGEQEELQFELEEQKQVLDRQKVAKAHILQVTRNDERRYQQLLVEAIAEKEAIEAALVSGVEVGPVKQGDPIALVGNSGYPGCSTGTHLHFEVRKNGSWVDPNAYLQPKTVLNEQDGERNVSLGSGSWPWPVQDTVRLTQFYGNTPFSWRYSYSGGIHTGLDMLSTSSAIISAPADGTLYKSSQSCGSSVINIAYIDHGNDLISLYLHVQ